MTQDDVRANFLAALSRADVVLSSFEASFTASSLSCFNFSRKQRLSIDRMMAKYAAKIGFNGEDKSLAARAEAEAERVAKEARLTRRVVVGGQVRIMPVKRSALAMARPHAKAMSQIK